MNRTPQLTWDDLGQLFVAWSDCFGASPLYWRIHDRPVCSVLNLTDFVHQYGEMTFRLMLLFARKTMRQKLGVDPYIIGVVNQTNPRNALLTNQLPLDATTGYALLPNWQGPPVQRYDALIRQRVGEWYAFQRHTRVPFLPVASAGWDATVRGERLPWLDAQSGFPWTPVVAGVEPKLFGTFLDEALAFNARMHPETNVVFIHAWNEWTESSVVEPSDRFGTAFLEEIHQRRGSIRAL